MGESEISNYISYLAVNRNVSASTQNQALNAIVFLYKQVLKQELGDFGNMERAKRPKRLPTVLTKNEADLVLAVMSGENAFMAKLLYGCGLRLMECLRLRVKDIEFGSNQIIVRDGKGQKDRVTMLPEQLKTQLIEHLERVRVIHEKDLKRGFGEVYLPYALLRKYPNAAKEWYWQYVFPSTKISSIQGSPERKIPPPSCKRNSSSKSGSQCRQIGRYFKACQPAYIQTLFCNSSS